VNAPKPLLLTPNWSHVEQALEDPGRDRDVSIAAFIIQLVSLSTGVRADTIASGTRHRAKAARARQIAMYLTHTAMAWPLARWRRRSGATAPPPATPVAGSRTCGRTPCSRRGS